MIVDRIFYTLTRRWLLFLNLAIAFYVGLPILAPPTAPRSDQPAET